MAVDVLLGLQWGDEGKGKIVDVLTPQYDVVARFQGGPNAGHTLIFDGKKVVLNTIPSGIFREKTINIIGNGVVINPIILQKELLTLAESGIDLKQTLYISEKAHLILPTHPLLDASTERSKGEAKIGSTLKGIGPTYMDKVGRYGIRIGDIKRSGFMHLYQQAIDRHMGQIPYQDIRDQLPSIAKDWFNAITFLKQYTVIASEHIINNFIKEEKTVLAEGAQGTLLDIEFGSYPFVTSSNTITAGACTGLGIAPKHINEIFGIFKAYCTRVGSGPFPTEQKNETGELLRSIGKEFGATTGRARRCGWLDLPALKYAIMLNGVTQLLMTKADVLSHLEYIPICTHYKTDEGLTDCMPYSLEGAEPIYTQMKGWKTDISALQSFDELPKALKDYIAFIESETGVPITIVSVGPDRKQTIVRK